MHDRSIFAVKTCLNGDTHRPQPSETERSTHMAVFAYNDRPDTVNQY